MTSSDDALSASSRLNCIQKAILDCLDISADVMDILGAMGTVSEGALGESCQAFLKNIKQSQVNTTTSISDVLPCLLVSVIFNPHYL